MMHVKTAVEAFPVRALTDPAEPTTTVVTSERLFTSSLPVV